MFFPVAMLLFGIVEFGRVFSLQLRFQQAAREAAREIALHYDDPAWDPNSPNTIVDGLLNDVVGHAGFSRTISGCTAPDDDASVLLLLDDESLAIPLTSMSTITLDVAAFARMPCEG